MFNIEMAGYAALPGLLALVLAVLIVPGIHRFYSHTNIFPRHLIVISTLFITGLFILLLLFLDPRLLSVAFLAGVLSTVLFLSFSFAVFKSAGACSSKGNVRSAGLSLGIASSGLALVAAGIFLSYFAWSDVSILNTYAFGAASALFIISIGITGKEGDADLRPVVHAADFHMSSLCVLVAAMAIGAAVTEFQHLWISMPVLFVMAGLSALLVVTVAIRAAIHGGPWFFRCLACLSAFVGMAVQYFILRELTRKMSADTIAGLGMLDRMGPFWALLTGVLTGVLLFFLSRRVSDRSAHGYSNPIFGFSLYFMAVGLWISYLFAELYGIAFAGIGMLGVLTLPAGQMMVQSEKDNQGRGSGFIIGAAVFSTIAVVAAFIMWVREEADLEDGLTEISVLAGLILGVGMVYVMRALAKKFSGRSLKDSEGRSPFHSLLLFGIVTLVIPLLVGFVVGPETLGGLLLGMVLLGVYEVFRMDRQGDCEKARDLNGLMRLAALVSLVSAPLMLI